jgi:hypothetical protein
MVSCIFQSAHILPRPSRLSHSYQRSMERTAWRRWWQSLREFLRPTKGHFSPARLEESSPTVELRVARAPITMKHFQSERACVLPSRDRMTPRTAIAIINILPTCRSSHANNHVDPGRDRCHELESRNTPPTTQEATAHRIITAAYAGNR